MKKADIYALLAMTVLWVFIITHNPLAGTWVFGFSWFAWTERRKEDV